jgi:hypothetical protein
VSDVGLISWDWDHAAEPHSWQPPALSAVGRTASADDGDNERLMIARTTGAFMQVLWVSLSCDATKRHGRSLVGLRLGLAPGSWRRPMEEG